MKHERAAHRGVSRQDEPITVVIVDDHLMFAESLAKLLDDNDDIKVVGTAVNADEARSLIATRQPDVMLIDYQIPDRHGVTTEIKKRYPNVTTVILSDVDDTNTAVDAIDAGRNSFLTKHASATEVASAIRTSAAGHAHIPPALVFRLLRAQTKRNDEVDLTARETQMLMHLAQGRSTQAIAHEMGVTTSTVRNLVQSTLTKLDAHSRLEAVATARRRGLLAG